MKYVIYDYSTQGLSNWAVLLGKDNIKLIDKKENITLYYFEYNDIQFYYPQASLELRLPIETNLENFALNYYSELIEYKKIISLHNPLNQTHLDFVNDLIEKYKSNSIIVHLQFQGDPSFAIYKNDSVKTITSTFNVQDKDNKNVYTDIKLCIPFFYYKHLLSLVNFDNINCFENKNPEDKIFMYSRRIYETSNPDMRDRKYFANKLREFLSEDKYEFGDRFRYEIEGERISFGAYHLGNYFDYNEYMFNVVSESIYSDSPPFSTNNFISEKSMFAILFSNPFFLLANIIIRNIYKDMGIEFLNDEFDTDDIGDKFEMFCKFINNSTYEQRFELYKKYKVIQKQNREILLNYIRNPKLNCLEFLLN
jgi:hypothetical protein